MRALNAIGGRVHAMLEQGPGVHVVELATSIEIWVNGGSPVESYATQATFAAAYGLDLPAGGPVKSDEAIIEAVATANAHLENACLPSLRELEQAVTAGAPQVQDFTPHGQRQDDYAMGWNSAMGRVYDRMRSVLVAQRAINNAAQTDA
ncbi:hypothetical protein ISE1_2719 [plant metagenome]|uniref:Uncharacterized protein n=1 Tax=plant metagenome TaxID=1297885 RepID=A0A484U2B4_9ZZZZ